CQRDLPVPGLNEHRLSGIGWIIAYGVIQENASDGCRHCGARRPSRADGGQDAGDFGVAEPIACGIDTSCAAQAGNGDFAQDFGQSRLSLRYGGFASAGQPRAAVPPRPLFPLPGPTAPSCAKEFIILTFSKLGPSFPAASPLLASDC